MWLVPNVLVSVESSIEKFYGLLFTLGSAVHLELIFAYVFGSGKF